MSEVGCPDRVTLVAFAADELPVAISQQISAHVESCASCQAVLREWRQGEYETTAPEWAAPEAALSVSALTDYEILDEIGRGGMGVVYRARDGRLGRVVAIKLLREEHLGDSAGVARFQTEARITGQLQHPGIPPVYELGTYLDNQPFLAMKLVKGQTLQTLLHNCRDLRQERGRFLAIFEQICHAVGYANAHRVIHRDLKPANVMVGAFGEVQVMDWGLAKVLGADAEAERATDPLRTVVALTAIETPPGGISPTRTGSVMGTLAYMPPEQAGGEVHKLDARSDVFGLGAILCQILTGAPPYSATDGNEARLQAIRGDLADAHARLDGCGAEPELTALCQRCLSFKQEDRPADGATVADEVARIRQAAEDRARVAELSRAAAVAREAEQRKRRWHLMVGAAAIMSLLIVAIVGTTFGLVRAERQRSLAESEWQRAETNAETADRERNRAEENLRLARQVVAEYTTKVSESQELKAHGLDGLRRKLLQTGVDFLKEFVQQRSDDPGVRADQARALLLLGNVTTSIADQNQALANYKQAINIYQHLTQSQPDELNHAMQLAVAHTNLGMAYLGLSKLAEAEKALEAGRAIREQILSRHRERHDVENDLAGSFNMLALVQRQQGNAKQAEAFYQKSIAIRERLHREHPQHTEILSGLARTSNNLGNFYRATGRTSLAEKAFLKSLQYDEQLVKLQPDPDSLLELSSSLNNLAILYRRSNRAKLSEEFHGRALALRQQLVRRHPAVSYYQAELAKSHHNLGNLYRQTNRPKEAEAAYAEALSLRERLVESHPKVADYQADLASILNSLGILYRTTGRPEESEKVYQRALALRRKVAADYPKVIEYQQDLTASLNNFGNLLSDQDRNDEAAKLYEEALTVRERIARAHPHLPSAQADVAATLSNLAIFYHTRRPDLAEKSYKRAEEIYRQLAADHPKLLEYVQHHGQSLSNLGALWRIQKKPKEARNVLVQALSIQEKLLADHPTRKDFAIDVADTSRQLGHLYRDTGKSQEALSRYSRSIELIAPLFKAQPRSATLKDGVRRAHEGRAIVLCRLGKHKEALPDWDRAAELDTGKSKVWVTYQRARTRATLGDHARALADVKGLDVSRDGPLLWEAACLYALASRAAGKDEGLTAEQRERLKEEYARNAVEFLKKTLERRYPGIGYMTREPALAGLREREDFRALAARTKQKK